MSLIPDALIELTVERPVAGGRMLGRHQGQVVLVSGGIPGERVRARIEKTTRHVAWAETTDVLEASADRRTPICDLACGGSFYGHVAYPSQLLLKAEVIADAFRRVGKVPMPELPPVYPSPEEGYRLRARLHVRDGRAGFFREGSHDLCDPAGTRQLHPSAMEAVASVLRALGARAVDCEAITLAENVAATQRVLHLEPRAGRRLDDVVPDGELSGVSGLTTIGPRGLLAISGSATVTDSAQELFGDDAPVGAAPAVWTRRASSFFQANRFLVGALARRVVEAAQGARCVDLFSGVGLFAIAVAARGARVIAVEGDPVSGADLVANAAAWRDSLRVVRASVEDFLVSPPGDAPDVVIVDPPRTGLSSHALTRLLRWNAAPASRNAAQRLVYVSCDPPTLARDAARILAGGYGLTSIEAFDLFPNTPHVETLAVFDRG
jgi:23S rRNA (uracil1939-C5)-methyltransferase